eukprot:CAMPEP_0170472558 /NCGR_PEP_ID=MMETSP0123-20130129/14584_1 /TAXON_ID=182087 /ORGANISM="Favella ehrenbergii, Strain Fehren 1" /LENGTH=45 /DNA_ID= /DNA_START= /DNA_END= /DNA_ORIENTATION=
MMPLAEGQALRTAITVTEQERHLAWPEELRQAERSQDIEFLFKPT